jgi:NADH:ubiquinone oxidoreductase subunit 4 (subunit M)
MLVAFVYMYQKAGSFIRRFIQIKLSNRTIMDILGFLLSVCIKIPLIPFHTWQTNVYQKHCWDNAFIWYHAKNGIVVSVGNAIGHWQQSICIFS